MAARRPIILSFGLLAAAAYCAWRGLQAFVPAGQGEVGTSAGRLAAGAKAGVPPHLSTASAEPLAFGLAAAAALAGAAGPVLRKAALRASRTQLPSRGDLGAPWDGRRAWTAVNVVNHAIYAALFIIRSFFYTGVGSTDRPFYYESYFLGFLCGPSAFLPTILGWTGHRYNQPVVLKWMTAVNSPTSSAYPAWITTFVSDPSFMYYYQIAEGTFHFMIVLGGLAAFRRSWAPKEGDRSLSLFRWGVLLELVLMDISYGIAYTYLPMLGVPGHWGLTTIMMLIHHLNVLPDVVCGWYEWKAWRAGKQAARDGARRQLVAATA